MNTPQNKMAKSETNTNETNTNETTPAQRSPHAQPNHWVVGPGAVGRLLALRLAGQNLVPDPPAMITTYRALIAARASTAARRGPPRPQGDAM